MFGLYIKLIKRTLYPECIFWWLRGFTSPSPSSVKLRVLKRYSPPNSCWVETGTYLGQTSRKLSKFARTLKTIEPDSNLFNFSSNRLRRFKKIQVLFGKSENILEKCLEDASGSICFWLDGHFSGDVTYKGDLETPILTELEVIKRNVRKFSSIVIFIDDVREFVNSNGRVTYPGLITLVDFANTLGLNWTIEHDIFICWSEELNFINSEGSQDL